MRVFNLVMATRRSSTQMESLAHVGWHRVHRAAADSGLWLLAALMEAIAQPSLSCWPPLFCQERWIIFIALTGVWSEGEPTIGGVEITLLKWLPLPPIIRSAETKASPLKDVTTSPASSALNRDAVPSSLWTWRRWWPAVSPTPAVPKICFQPPRHSSGSGYQLLKSRTLKVNLIFSGRLPHANANLQMLTCDLLTLLVGGKKTPPVVNGELRHSSLSSGRLQ